MATYIVTMTMSIEVEASSTVEAEEIARNRDVSEQEAPCWSGFEIEGVRRIK